MKVRRGDLRDVYAEGGRSVVMVGETVVVLSELATAILHEIPPAGAIGTDQIAEAMVAIFGEPEAPDSATALTLNNIHELIGYRVLVDEEPDTAVVAASTPASVEALRSAIRHIRRNESAKWHLPENVGPHDFIASVDQHHLASFLDVHPDRLALPPGVTAHVRETASQRAAAVQALIQELAEALDVLDRVGVRALAVKGIALAAQAYGDIAARGAGDLDLLVDPNDLDRAHAALTSASWSHDPSFPAPGPSWAWRHLRRSGHEVTLLGHRSTIDLHWHLSPSHGTFPPFNVLWERRCEVRIGARDVATLSSYDALAHSAGHAAKDEWPWLRSLLDVHLLASDPDVWRAADRPLRSDQLITVGLAVRMFGIPAGAAPVVHRAALMTDQVWDEVIARQVATTSSHRRSPVPGVALRKSSRTSRRTAAAPRDVVRQLGFSLLPPWLTVEEPSRHAAIAVPRLLAKRARGIAARLKA